MTRFILTTPYREDNKLILNEAYLTRFRNSGIVPIINDYYFNALDYLPLISGILLTGGGDLGKNILTAPIHAKASDIDNERDRFELEVIKRAVDKKIPILGICRGAQVLNSALGGILNQHIEGHKQEEARNKATHNIKIKKGTLIYDIIGADNIDVNSFHHQCILSTPQALRISAVSDDNIIEAVEWFDKSYFCMGVQWHPEALDDEYSDKIFNAFITECMKNK